MLYLFLVIKILKWDLFIYYFWNDLPGVSTTMQAENNWPLSSSQVHVENLSPREIQLLQYKNQGLTPTKEVQHKDKS